MAAVNVGVVGVGYLGSRHARVYSQLKNANLVCVCDIDKKNAKKVARKHRVWYFPDYHTLFDKVEAVSLAVPTSLHHKIAKEFLENGIHVLIEKPITKTVKEAEELTEIARSNQFPNSCRLEGRCRRETCTGRPQIACGARNLGPRAYSGMHCWYSCSRYCMQ